MALDSFLRPIQQRRNKLSELKIQLRDLQDRRQELEHAVNDYKIYEPVVERGKLDILVAKISGLSQDIANIESSKAALHTQLRAVRSEQINPALFWKFFTAEQKKLRVEVGIFKRKVLAVDQRIESDKTALSKTKYQAVLARERLAEHEKFDLEGTVVLLSGFPESIERTNADLAELGVELTQMEARIQPHMIEHKRLKAETSALNADIAAAEAFSRDLNTAANGHDRKMIHAKCEGRFGTGRPNDVINDRRGKMRPLENNIPKLERRISEELERSVRKVEHLLIDGNNVCYEGQSFIELRALTALLTVLAGRYAVTVVFDASIRSLLKASTQDIKRSLGSTVTTYIAPTKTGADEYLLKLAEGKKSTFVFSNDRYAEYHDYDAVRSERLLRFMIADGKIMANDLDITANI